MGGAGRGATGAARRANVPRIGHVLDFAAHESLVIFAAVESLIEDVSVHSVTADCGVLPEAPVVHDSTRLSNLPLGSVLRCAVHDLDVGVQEAVLIAGIHGGDADEAPATWRVATHSNAGNLAVGGCDRAV